MRGLQVFFVRQKSAFARKYFVQCGFFPSFRENVAWWKWRGKFAVGENQTDDVNVNNVNEDDNVSNVNDVNDDDDDHLILGTES